MDTFNPLRLTEQVADLYLADVLAPVEETSEPEKAAAPTEDTKPEPLTPAQLAEFEGDYYTEELDTTYSYSRARRINLWRNTYGMTTYSLTHADGHFLGNTWFFPKIHFHTRRYAGRVTGS